MSPTIVNESALARVIQDSGWADINELRAASRKAGVFSPEFYDHAIENAEKAALRRALRSGKIKDEAGNVILVASIIIEEKAKDGSPCLRRVYKQEMLFDIGDCIQVINYWRSNRNKCDDRIKYYAKLAIELHGPQVQGLLPMD